VVRRLNLPPPPLLPAGPSRLPGPRRGESKLDAALVALGQSADVLTTEIALSRAHLREGNPLLRQRVLRIGLKAAVAAGSVVLCGELRRRGQPGKARIVAVAGFAIGAAAAVHNVRMVRRQR
jgi:hypothetical protein